MLDDFCVFILSHGRPDNVITYATLRKCGYTGNIKIIVDNQDKTVERYREIYGEQVIVFDKQEWIAKTDYGDNFDEHRSVIYARNACFEIARNIGVAYFMELDDDYNIFSYRYISQGLLKQCQVKCLDDVLRSCLTYFASAPLTSIAFMQNGDLMGGARDDFRHSLRRRKCMNSFICSVHRPFQFVAKMNDDVSTYVSLGARGHVFLTMSQITLNQKQTQGNAGGLTDIYLSMGTYAKSFYSVMFAPSSVYVTILSQGHARIHHHISWKHAVPQIVRESHRKV